MLYYDFTANNKDYKLRLNVRNTIELEKKLGCNPLMVFGEGTLPPTETLITIFHACFKQYNHGISWDDAATILDEWLEDGNNMTDFYTVLLDIFKVSGIYKEVEVEAF